MEVAAGKLQMLHQDYLLKSMKRNLLLKMQSMDYSNLLNIGASDVESIANFREFDDKVTAPLHGFKDAEHYYDECSANRFIDKIQCPTLILHAP